MAKMRVLRSKKGDRQGKGEDNSFAHISMRKTLLMAAKQ